MKQRTRSIGIAAMLVTASFLASFSLTTLVMRLVAIAHDPAIEQLDCGSVLVVRYSGGSDAEATYYIKDAFGWKKSASCSAFVGKNGLGKTAEGDGRTPVGAFHAMYAFGALPCPGGRSCPGGTSSSGRAGLEYRPLTPSTFACDEQGPFYNTVIDTSAVHHRCCGEDMSRILPAYNYGIALDFNPSCTYPLGSNIFVHCYGNNPFTAGCIALPDKIMRRIIRTATADLQIIITE